MPKQLELPSLKEYFSAIYVINLPSRQDRWDSFLKRIQGHWPFGKIIRFPATNGNLVPPPSWWTASHGAWGCYRSHVRILEECLANNIDRVLIFEDDAFLIDGFAEECQQFLSNVPDNWKMLYLGGQHLEQESRVPRKINDYVYQPYNVNRQHCYAIQGREAMIRLYHHLHDYKNWKPKHHTDHHNGELHKKTKTGIYVPAQWLVGQAAGRSNITQTIEQDKIWIGAKQLIESPIQKPMVAVLGAYRSGTSCTTGVLNALGLYVGERVQQPSKDNPTGFFEEIQLGQLCRTILEEPWMVRKRNKEDATNLLRWWGSGRDEAFRDDQVKMIVAKHPSMCMQGPELMEAWDQPKFIVVDRPIEDSIRSLKKANWGWPPEAIEYLIPKMLETREDFLTKTQPDHLRVDFTQLCQNPELIVEQLCNFLSINPTNNQREAAIKFVNRT